jgi:hypothetical protein
MDANSILAELRVERDRIARAISALEAIDSTRRLQVGPVPTRKRIVSAASRARMAAAQRAQWAKVRAQQKAQRKAA